MRRIPASGVWIETLLIVFGIGIGFVLGCAVPQERARAGLEVDSRPTPTLAPAPTPTPAAPAPAPAPTPSLHFVAGEGATRELSLASLRQACPERTVEVDDPYHERRMRYLALPLRCVLEEGFADRGGAAGLRGQGLLLRALDGYTRPVAGDELLAADVFLAFAEPDRWAAGERGQTAARSAFRPIDRRQVDPAPFYMVWTGVDRNDPHEHPWPYQLARIEIAPFETAFPRTVPDGLTRTDAGWRGYELFQRACASCHSINGQGGKVGPDLNVPRSIVEYRPIPQIRAYILDPQATRYTSMPSHPGFSEADLDALIAYLSAMSQRKDDPRKDPRKKGDS